MDKVLKMKEKQEALDAEIREIREKNFEAMKERCRVDVTKKGEIMDFLGRLHKERREAIQEENILRAKENSELFNKHIEQTKKLAEGILKLKNEEILEQKNRQLLRSENIELKELESQLKSSYAAKTLQVQLRERQAMRDNEKYLDHQDFLNRSRWYNNDVFDRLMKDRENDIKIKYKNDLQDQLINNEILRHKRSEECQRERKIVEEISEVIYKENMRLDEERREKISQIRKESEAFFKAKEIWKCKEKEAILDEFQRNNKIITDKMNQEYLENRNKINRSMARDLTIENMVKKILDDEIKRNEKEFIVNELIVEEENNEVIQNLKNEAVKKETLKRELIDDMNRQTYVIEQRKIQDKKVDEAFGKYLNQQFEISLKNDKEKAEERRKIGIKYGNDLKSVIEKNREDYAKEILIRKKLLINEEEEERKRLENVAIEKSKMLYEHAKNLNGFLKPGTLKPEDYEYIKTKES